MADDEILQDRERMVPEVDREELIYSEHLVRYLFASGYVEGKRVLDVACGSGYGSDLLRSAGAAEVVGVDRAPEAIRYCRSHYPAAARFLVADAESLPLPDASFDVVVSFETLEHVPNQRRFLGEVRRLLTTGGLAIVSTPNRAVYPPGNPYHVTELLLPELERELRPLFRNVSVVSQDNWVTSAVLRADLMEQSEGLLEEPASVAKLTARPPDRALYLVALCSDGPLPPARPHLALASVSEAEFVRAELARRDVEIEAMRSRVITVNDEWQRIADDLGAQIEQARTAIARLEARLAARETRARAGADELGRLLADRDRQVAELRQELAGVQRSLAWSLMQRYRALLERVAPPASGRRRAYARALAGARRLAAGAGTRRLDAASRDPAGAAVVLPAFRRVRVSIVIPTHDNSGHLFRCLASVAEHTDGVPYEVIVVDDASTDDTPAMLGRVPGVRVLRQTENVGFVNACNAGAARASGEYLVFLNNDTLARPGWLAALLEPARADRAVGIVGAKLVYPDGRLQEAGGIVFRDGSGWNYGRGDDPERPEYNYVREVDYCSGACLLVRRDLFERAGGFDTRYAPAYYEDADLAFTARRMGYQVVYQPRAEVVHVEGVSHGTDASGGLKRYQGINRGAFVEKWSAVLDERHFPPGESLLRARDRRDGPRAVVIDHLVPTHDQDAGSSRMFHLLRFLTDMGFVISFVPDNMARMEPYTGELQQMGVEVLHDPVEVADHLRGLGPYVRLAIASRPLTAWKYVHKIRELAPSALLAYDTVDLHFLREERRAEIEGSDATRLVARGYRELELALVRVSDATITVTEQERALLAREVPGARIHVIPTVHEVSSGGHAFADRKGLLFVGNFHHPPNPDAVAYLVSDILPLIRAQIPEMVLFVVGGHAGPAIDALASEDVVVTGWVPDLGPHLDSSRVFVAPLRFGAGLKGKIGQSMAHGLPVVTSSIGVEGMDVAHEREVLVADDAAGFAEAVVRVYRDRELWTSLSESAMKFVAHTYAPEVVRSKMRAALTDLGVLPWNEPGGSGR